MIMKFLKCLGFFLLAVLVFFGFVVPFFMVPRSYENKARELAEARVANAASPVDQHYIDESVNDAMTGDINNIFKTCAIIGAAAALIVFCFSLRAPHDCGGLNLFNPIYLVFIALISILTSVSLSLFFGAHQSAQAEGFLMFVRDVSRAFADKQLILMLLVPAVLELIFRGVIFSYLEKIHFSVAMVLSTVAYAVAAYIMVFTHAKWSQGNTEAASCAFFIAFFIGAVHGVLTWRLRSVIPAVLSHMLMAVTAGGVTEFCSRSAIPYPAALAALAVVLAAFILLPALFSKKCRALAFDYPFTALHLLRDDWLYSRKKKDHAQRKNPDGSIKPETALEKAGDKADAAVEKIESKVDTVEEKVDAAVKKVEEKAKATVEKVTGSAKKKSEKAEEKVEEAVEKAEEKVEEAAEKAEEKVVEAEEKAEEKIEENAEKAEEKVEETAEKAEEKVEEAAEKAEEKAEEVTEKAEEKLEEKAGE